MRNLECSERKIEFDYKSGTGIFIRQGRGKATLKIKYRGAYGMGEKYDAVNQKGKKVINEVKENTPMMRPLFYQFPEDENGLNCEDEYMFGEDYLVAPFMEEDQTRREVYLPEGKWKDFFTGEVFKGGQVILSSEGGKIPVFIRI